MEITVNGRRRRIAAEPDMPLLWVLRETLGLPGTKYGCGVGVCGACTVHVDGKAVTSCTLPVEDVGNAAVTTIEGLGGRTLHPVQQAWLDEQVAQCGYCQPGMMMAAAALLKRSPRPSDTEIAAIPNVCRCGTYPRVRAAIRRAAANGDAA